MFRIRNSGREKKDRAQVLRKKKRNGDYKRTRHHSIPRVVCKENGIDPGFKGNIIPKPRIQHEAWHTLFNAHTPWKVAEMLRSGEFRLLSEKKERAYLLIFGNVSLKEAAHIVEKEWIGLYDPDTIRKLFESKSSG